MQVNLQVLGAALFILASGAAGASAYSQTQQQSKPPAQNGPQSPSTAPPQAPGGAAAPATPAAPPVNQEEEDAYKAFFDARATDPAKQIQLGEDFLKKFTESHYLPAVYTQLTAAYMDAGQEDKMFVAGDKALELDPDNIGVLSMLAMAIPRRISSNTLDAAQQYQRAETFARRAIDLIITLQKPDGVDDAAFQKAKGEYLSMAHSGLGLIAYQRKQYADATNELSLAVKFSSNPDPVDYYLLGSADVQTSHFNEAAMAYEKCASATGPLAAQCKTREEDAKKRASTQLSTPN